MHESSVSVRVVQGLIAAVVAAGVDRRRFETAAGIDAMLLKDDDARIPRSQVLHFCSVALDVTGDAAFGLHWGEQFTDSTFTPLSHLIAHSPTLRAGLETLFAYQRLLTDEVSYELIEQGNSVLLRLSALPNLSPRLRIFILEMEAIGIYRLMRTFGAAVLPQRVSFNYAAPSYRAEYTRVFSGIPCGFEQPESSLTFSTALMSSAPLHKDDEVRAALHGIAARRVLRLTKSTPYAIRVREQIVKLGPRMRTDMTHVADALGLSVRSLRRRLDEEGVSFSAIASEAASLVAKDLLEVKRKSIQETAFEMGFADSAGFHRAFKRWTGVTPGAFLDSGDDTSRLDARG